MVLPHAVLRKLINVSAHAREGYSTPFVCQLVSWLFSQSVSQSVILSYESRRWQPPEDWNKHQSVALAILTLSPSDLFRHFEKFI